MDNWQKVLIGVLIVTLIIFLVRKIFSRKSTETEHSLAASDQGVSTASAVSRAFEKTVI